jgi:hypothetical protein
MNTANPVIFLVAHLIPSATSGSSASSLAIMPVTGGSLDPVGALSVHSSLTGKVIDGVSIVDSCTALSESYGAVDFCLLGWDTARILNVLQRVLPDVRRLVGERVIDMSTFDSVLKTMPNGAPFKVEPPSASLEPGEALDYVLDFYNSTLDYLAASQYEDGSLHSASSAVLGEPTNAPVIGIGGTPERVAKLVEAFGDDWVALDANDGLYDAVLVLNPYIVLEDGALKPFTEAFIEDFDSSWSNAYKNPYVRDFMERLDVDVIRGLIDEKAWCGMLDYRIWALLREGKKVLVSNVRFPDEVDVIHSRNGLSVRVASSTSIEQGVPDVADSIFDILVVDDGSPSGLEQQARNIEELTR